MMDGMKSGEMMWGMGVFGLLILLVLVLGLAALVKYVFFRCVRIRTARRFRGYS